MKLKSVTIPAITICFMQACNEPQKAQFISAPNFAQPAIDTNSKEFVTTYYTKKYIPLYEYNNHMGYWENGQLITEFDCPDAHRDFPPIDIKQWNKVPVVNGRLPSYEETKSGAALHHYGEKENPYVKPYNMVLPKLAVYHNPIMNTNEIVIIIQIAQSSKDTVVSFRYPTGGCGGNTFSHFHFLTDEEVKKVIQ